jgi:hypothetical protein
MSKSHRDFVVYVKNGVEINALVAISHEVTTPATQTMPAFVTEHLTLVYLDPGAASQRPSGDQLRNSIKIDFDVAPLVSGKTFGWKDVVEYSVVQPEVPGSGSERWGEGDWTSVPGEGREYPNSKVVPGPDGLTDAERGSKWGSPEHLAGVGSVQGQPGHSPEELVQTDPELYKAFNDNREGKVPDSEESYTDTLRANAEHSNSQQFPSGDGWTPSGHGANPAPDGTDPAQLDNPAPSSPKDEAVEQGPVVGE